MTDTIAAAWRHRYAGPVLRVVLAYVVLVEGLVQLVFGRIDFFGLFEFGRRSAPIPRAIFLNGASIGLLYGMLGMGLILIYRANRIINFAQAGLGAVPATAALLFMLRRGVPYAVVFPLALVGGAMLGAAVEVPMRRFRNSPRLIFTVATIGVSLFLVFLEFKVQVWIAGDLVTSSAFRTPFTRFGFDVYPLRFNGDFIAAAVITGLVCAALGAFFKFTDMGIAVRASAENGERAALLGIPVARVSTVVWAIGGVLSVIAIFLRAPLVGLALGGTISLSVLLYGLAAAVVARMESLPLCVLAGMGIGIVDQSALFSTRRATLSVATMLVVIVVALLAQRGKLSRALDAATGTWQAVREYRPIPLELRDTREVVIAKGIIANAVFFFVLVLPRLLPDRFHGRFTIVVLIAMVGVSLVMLTGWAGQISLGQYAFAGVGAGVAGGLQANHGQDFFVCLLVGGLAGAVAAVLVGLPALRIQGPFLAATTLAFAFTVQNFFLNIEFFDWILPSRQEAVTRPILWGRFDLRDDLRFYYVCVAFLVLACAAAWSLRRNRFGRILLGVRDNPRLAQAFGVNLAFTKLAGFALSGFVAAVAGGLMAFQLQSVEGAAFAPQRSLEVFAMTVFGGMTTIAGPLIGAAVIEGIPFAFDGDPLVRLLTSSAGLLLVLVFLPAGLSQVYFGLRDKGLRWVAARHGIHVPSLIADSLVTGEDEAPMEPAPHVLVRADAIRCPSCGVEVTLVDAPAHEHFMLPADELVGTQP